jgi:hypothetical protein
MQSILCFGLGLLLTSMALHIVIWRSFPVRNQPSRLVLIFIALPALIVAACLTVLSSWSVIPKWSWAMWCLVYLLDFSLSAAYICVFTAITGFSPSIAIVERVGRSMPLGLPRNELVPHWFTHEKLTGARHDNLVTRGLISDTAGILRLQPRGRFVARCFLIFRRFLGLPDMAGG